MQLNEFVDTKAYELVTADVAGILSHLEAIWQGEGAGNGRSIPKQRGNRRRKLMDKWRQDRINRQSSRARSSLR